MTTVNAHGSSITRNSSQVLLQAIASLSLSALSEALGVDDSVACRIRSGEARVTLSQACALIDAAGKKLVSRDSVCVNREKYAAMSTLLVAAMADEQTTRRLIWEDEA